MVSVHWAAGVSGLVNGLTKNMFAVFRFRPVLLIGAAVSMALFCVAPFVFVATADTRVAGGVALVSIAGLYVLSSRTSRISPVYALMFPIGATLLAYSMLQSMYTTVRKGGVTWRGTFYPLSELRAHARSGLRL